MPLSSPLSATGSKSISDAELAAHAREIRKAALRMSFESHTSHIGCALSFADILATLYFRVLRLDPGDPKAPERDRVILSKGHGVVGLYAALGERGFFPRERYGEYCREGSVMASHIVRGAVPGAETSGGSGGHGLSLGVGMALALKQQGLPSRVFVVSGDGEIEEGSVWEAALFAGVHRLSNLILVIDHNHLQDGTDGSHIEQILDLAPLDRKFEAFRWSADVVDGHDYGALAQSLSRPTDGPHVVIAHTVKGKGVGFMEGDGLWHGKVPSRQEYEVAIKELDHAF